jgi:hypothetical protein
MSNETFRDTRKLADAIDPKSAPDGDWRDRLLSKIHADIEMQGRANEDRAVPFHLRNVVLGAVAAAFRNLQPTTTAPDSDAEQVKALDREMVNAAAVAANQRYGQWMPQIWVDFFIEEYGSRK